MFFIWLYFVFYEYKKKNIWFKTRATICENVIDNLGQCYKCNAHKLYDDTHYYFVKNNIKKPVLIVIIFFMNYELKSMLMSSFEVFTCFNWQQNVCFYYKKNVQLTIQSKDNIEAATMMMFNLSVTTHVLSYDLVTTVNTDDLHSVYASASVGQ
jgi:hypothetical protein